MDAEEAMHDTFMKLFANMNKLDKNSNFYAWSKSIAVNTAIDRVRKKKLYVEPIDHLHVVDEEGVDEEALKFSVDKVKQKLSELPNGYRIVVSMHLFEGFDFEEISSILGVKEVSIRSQFSRGRKKLAELIKNEN
jgi:RNA polymerase sigma-70 factor (ECF subfamily)